jgi:hypothetical protein
MPENIWRKRKSRLREFFKKILNALHLKNKSRGKTVEEF